MKKVENKNIYTGRKMRLEEINGITLITLAVTIIIMLILAGVTIMSLSKSRLINKAIIAREETKKTQALEELRRKVLEVQIDKQGFATLQDVINALDLDTENEYIVSLTPTSSINGDIPDVSNATEIYVIYKKYQFKIDCELVVTFFEDLDFDINKDNNKVLSYDIKNNNETSTQYKKTILKDLTGNENNATLYNTTLAENRDGIIFNGTSSYAQLNLQQSLIFPLTIEMDISISVKPTQALIYLEPDSKTAFGISNGYFGVSISTYTNKFVVPSDFYDGNLKHIVLEYTSLTSFELYINGEKLTQSTAKGAWTDGIGTTPYLGRRSSGNYFNGNLYTFKIYNRILEENEIEGTTNRSDLILEYDLSKDDYYKITANQLIDLTEKNNNATCYNILYSDEKDGIIFDGTSSYAQLDLQENLTFPLTIEMDIATSTEPIQALIYLEPNSKTAFGISNGYFGVSISTDTNKFVVPSDFYDGNIKHIVLEYTSLTSFELYINGEKLTQSTSTGAWTSGVGSIAYLGRRAQGDYFKGILYKFNIYNRLLTEEEITEY